MVHKAKTAPTNMRTIGTAAIVIALVIIIEAVLFVEGREYNNYTYANN